MKRLLASIVAAALLAVPAHAQIVTYNSVPSYAVACTNASGLTSVCYVPAMYSVNGGGGGSVPTGTAGSPNAAVISVQGITGGTAVAVSDNGGSITVDSGTPGILALTAGSAIIGKVGIDQTTPGTTNGVVDSQSAAFGGEIALTVGTAGTAGRSLKAICTAAGNISVTYSDGSTGVWSATFGTQTYPIAVTTVSSAGTTATCTYSNLK